MRLIRRKNVPEPQNSIISALEQGVEDLFYNPEGSIPERVLLMSVLSRAIRDLASKSRHESEPAIDWFWSDETGVDRHITYLTLCELCDLDADALRMALVGRGELPLPLAA